MTLAIVGVVLNLFGVIGLVANGMAEYMPMLFGIICLFWVTSVIGIILHVSGMKKVGPTLVIIGSIVFIPLGLVAIFGAKKMKAKSENDLDERRKLAAENRGGNESPLKRGDKINP